jgi:hypothetical protein
MAPNTTDILSERQLYKFIKNELHSNNGRGVSFLNPENNYFPFNALSWLSGFG